MIRHCSAATAAVALTYCMKGGAAQYDGCTNGTVADIGNGRCDAALNVPACGYDGGDCCPCTCSDGPDNSCSDSDFDCVYPGCDDPSAQSAESSCTENWIADGWCDWSTNNNVECSWDGGDVRILVLEDGDKNVFCVVHVEVETCVGLHGEFCSEWLTLSAAKS